MTFNVHKLFDTILSSKMTTNVAGVCTVVDTIWFNTEKSISKRLRCVEKKW